MLIRESCAVLGLEYDECTTQNTIRHAYFKKSLLYHPDKNRAEDATEKFKKINDSYEILMKYHGFMDDNDNDNDNDNDDNDNNDEEKDTPPTMGAIPTFTSTLFSFLQMNMFQDIKTKVLHTIVDNLSNKCESSAHELMSKLNNAQYKKICTALRNNMNTFHIPEQFITKLEQKLENRMNKNTTVIINPTIHDLFSNNLYKLIDNGKEFLIPVWCHELIYEHGDAELCVQCEPILDDNIEIDINNDIHIKKEYTFVELWKTDIIQIHIGPEQFQIQRNRLKMSERQTIRLAKKGVPRMNHDNIYNVSRKSDVYIHIIIQQIG